MELPGLHESEITAYVLDDTPPVLSMGQRCREMGYGFHWEPYEERPTLLLPDKSIIFLDVDHNVPYIPAYVGRTEVALPATTITGGASSQASDPGEALGAAGDDDEDVPSSSEDGRSGEAGTPSNEDSGVSDRWFSSDSQYVLSVPNSDITGDVEGSSQMTVITPLTEE